MLAIHKYVQQKVVNELCQVFGTTNNISITDPDILNDLNNVDMVINETMRLFPITLSAVRTNSEEIDLGDYVVPKDSILYIPLLHIHRNKKYWGEDARVFRPERFMKENFEKIHQYAYLPFLSEFNRCD